MTAWRLLERGPLAAARNMAEDEALLGRFREGDAPLLRLYRWRPAAVSLGRFQRLDELAAVPADVPRVRRLTGGGAIFHREDELTYAIVAPYALFGAKRAGPKVAYHAVHGAIAAGLADLGLATAPATASGDEAGGRYEGLCYDRATSFDLKAGGGKLVGSAQRRRGHAFLQHGSIPVSRDPYARGAVSLAELLPVPVEADAVARAVIAGFERTLGARFEPSALRDDEDSLARELEPRYASEDWTRAATIR